MAPNPMETVALKALLDYEVRPRRWQSDALQAWLANNCRGTVAVVTGGGKTTFALLCMREFARRTREPRILIIVPSIVLLDQWVYSLRYDVGLPADSVWIATASNTSPRGLVGVAVINTARTMAPEMTAHGSWLLCVDECHRAGSPANAQALKGGATATLGLSATPRREYDTGFADHVAPALGEVIFDYGFAEAVRDGVVTPYLVANYRIPLEADEEHEFQRLTRLLAAVTRQREESAERVKAILRRRSGVLISARWRIPAAVRLALEVDRPTIIFHERIDAAHEIATLLEARGRRTVEYHSRIASGMRQRNLALFRQGIASVLVACRSLDEGMNVPEAEVGILAASSRSIRQRIQRMGRVLRRAPGKTVAQVCTIYASNVEEMVLRREAAELPEAASVQWFEAGGVR